MKISPIRTCLAMLICCVFTPTLTKAQTRIFNVTTTAEPGEVFGIQGDNFGTNPSVFIDKGIGPKQVTPITVSNQYLAAIVPADFGRGRYQVWVKNGSSKSNIALINQPQPWWGPLDIAGTEIDPGRQFRLQGRNLDLIGTLSTVRFVPVAVGASLSAAIASVDDQFLLKATAPADLVAGQEYDIYISNGYGGATKEVKGPRVKARAAGVDTWGLAVPWAAEFTFAANEYNVKTDSRLTNHAVGNGVANDGPAIQEAIDKANVAGGGVVYLPAGTYNIQGNGLILNSSVVIKGAGKDRSKVYDNTAGGFGYMIAASMQSRIGFVDVNFESGSAGFQITARLYNNTYVFALRSRFSNGVKETLYGGACNQMVVKECDVIHTPLTGKNVMYFTDARNLLLKDNYVQWSDGRIVLEGGTLTSQIQVEGNQFIRSVLTDGGGSYEFGGLAIGINYMTILNNTFDKLGNGQIPYYNDGETILNQNTIPTDAQGKSSGGTANTIRDNTKNFAVNSLAGRTINLIQGPGMGQERVVVKNTANSITVSPEWDVKPTSNTYYSVSGNFQEQLLIKGNILKNAPRGIWLYSNSIKDVAVVSNQLIDCENIYLRGDQRVNDRFVVQKNILVENNQLSSPQNWYTAAIRIELSQVTPTELYGNAFYNVVARKNEAEGFISRVDVESTSTSDNNTAGIMGVIWQDNIAQNTPFAHYLDQGSYQTIIWNTDTTATGALLADEMEPGATHASVKTVIGPTAFILSKGHNTDILFISPNPVSDRLRVSITGADKGPLELSIISAAGQTLQQWKNAKSTGKYEYEFMLSGVAKGLYLLQVKLGNKKMVKKFLVQ